MHPALKAADSRPTHRPVPGLPLLHCLCAASNRNLKSVNQQHCSQPNMGEVLTQNERRSSSGVIAGPALGLTGESALDAR